VRLAVPDPFVPFAEGGFPTPSGKSELVSAKLGAEGHDPVAGYVPRGGTHERARARPAIPLAFISPPAHTS